MKRINSLCGVFLWQGDIEKHHTARVSWDVVTKPTREGGLGIKNLTIWNKACCLKLIWLLFFQAGSVWVAWFVEEVLDGSLSNLWTTLPHRRYSWQVNKLLKLSSSIYSWIKLKVQNGVSCRFWSDNWSPFGSIRTYLSLGGNSRLGVLDEASLASLRRDNSWLLPPWFSTVWNKSGIPRHNFLSWLFVLNRCPTKDRIMRWGHQTSPMCLLCNQSDESRDHLFFSCQFSWSLWGSLSQRCGIVPEKAWERVLAQIQSVGARSTKGMLLRLSWQGCIYWAWMERNARLHRQVFRSADTVTRLLDRQIKDRILSLRPTNPATSSRLMQQWLN